MSLVQRSSFCVKWGAMCSFSQPTCSCSALCASASACIRRGSTKIHCKRLYQKKKNKDSLQAPVSEEEEQRFTASTCITRRRTEIHSTHLQAPVPEEEEEELTLCICLATFRAVRSLSTMDLPWLSWAVSDTWVLAIVQTALALVVCHLACEQHVLATKQLQHLLSYGCAHKSFWLDCCDHSCRILKKQGTLPNFQSHHHASRNCRTTTSDMVMGQQLTLVPNQRATSAQTQGSKYPTRTHQALKHRAATSKCPNRGR